MLYVSGSGMLLHIRITPGAFKNPDAEVVPCINEIRMCGLEARCP